jgi:hypothetical protein
MRLTASKSALEQNLFAYLRTVAGDAPQAGTPLLVEPGVLHALYAHPTRLLREALRYCVDAFLVTVHPDPATWGEVTAPVEALSLALAVHNALALGAADSDQPAIAFTVALLEALPPARDLAAALAYHAVLRGLSATNTPAGLWPALLERSPLTALTALDTHLPVALEALAVELLPGWRPRERLSYEVACKPEAWITTVTGLLAEPRLARWLRLRWLALPETRPTCRNLGLLLEALRRHGGQQDVILPYYADYAYFRAAPLANGWKPAARHWPLLDEITRLLCAAGVDELTAEAALQLNRRGNEAFLLFRALLEIVTEAWPLPDYPHIKGDFVMVLRGLVDYMTETARQGLVFGDAVFTEAGDNRL